MTHGEIVTDTGAVAAIVSPWWLPALHQVSDVAALLLPIAGVTWLIVQIVVKIMQARRQK